MNPLVLFLGAFAIAGNTLILHLYHIVDEHMAVPLYAAAYVLVVMALAMMIGGR